MWLNNRKWFKYLSYDIVSPTGLTKVNGLVCDDSINEMIIEH